MAEKSLSKFWDTAPSIPYEPEVAPRKDKKLSSFWDTAPSVPYESKAAPQDSWSGSFKALAEGGLDAVDTLTTLPTNLAIKSHNAQLENNSKVDPRMTALFDPFAPYAPPEQVEAAKLSEVPSIAETVIGQTPDEERTPLQQGLRFASSVATPGGFGKALAKGGGKAASALAAPLQAIGSTKPLVVAGAGAGGATSEYLKQEGFGGGSQLAGGFGADLGVQALSGLKGLKNIPRSGDRLAMRALGLTKNKLKIDALDSAERLGVDLPTAAATNSVSTALANQLIAKTPHYGDKLRDKIDSGVKQYQEAWDRLFDAVSPERDKKLIANISEEYEKAKALIPEGDTIKPTKVLDVIGKIREQVKSPTYSGSTTSMLKELKTLEESMTNLPKGFENLPDMVKKKILESPDVVKDIPVREFLNQKIQLNEIMNDKKIYDPKSDTRTLKLLKRVSGAITETLFEDYKKVNPKFAEELKKANTRFAQSKKREALEDRLADHINNPVTGETGFHPLIKMINSRKDRGFLKQNLGDELYKKIEDFVNVGQSLRSIKENTPNPSGTTPVSAVLNFIKGIASRSYTQTAVSIIGVHKTTQLLTDKRFLNKAKDFAKKPSTTTGNQLETIVKDNTGYTIQELNQLYRDEKNE